MAISVDSEGYQAFRGALADAFLRVDRYPNVNWTTSALLAALRQALEDLRTHQNVSQTDYDQALELVNELALAVEVLRRLVQSE